jgi:uncharacterized protein Yka (UPF0111/DUF47 family)
MKWLVLTLVTFSVQASLDDLNDSLGQCEMFQNKLKVIKERSGRLDSIKTPEALREQSEQLSKELDELEHEGDQLGIVIENRLGQKKGWIEIILSMFWRKSKI